jgi:hypothetical protein
LTLTDREERPKKGHLDAETSGWVNPTAASKTTHEESVVGNGGFLRCGN